MTNTAGNTRSATSETNTDALTLEYKCVYKEHQTRGVKFLEALRELFK